MSNKQLSQIGPCPQGVTTATPGHSAVAVVPGNSKQTGHSNSSSTPCAKRLNKSRTCRGGSGGGNGGGSGLVGAAVVAGDMEVEEEEVEVEEKEEEEEEDDAAVVAGVFLRLFRVFSCHCWYNFSVASLRNCSFDTGTATTATAAAAAVDAFLSGSIFAFLFFFVRNDNMEVWPLLLLLLLLRPPPSPSFVEDVPMTKYGWSHA